MTLLAIGINHKTASVELREKVAFGPDILPDALRQLVDSTPASEAVILSTCNRTEIYCAADDPALSEARNWLARFHGLDGHSLQGSVYEYQGEQAAAHLMRVAAGLDSLVLGEPQILGQLKQAWQKARDAGTLHSLLDRLFQRCFSVAKRIRTETEIGANAVSVAYAAVSLAKRIFEDLADSRVLLIGAGETIELVARHLVDQGADQLMVANRTLARAEEVADAFSAEVMTLNQIPDRLAEADIVIASTASPLPLLGKGMVEQALRRRRKKPMLLVDLAVPRDIESAVEDLDDAYLYTVDDLQGLIEENIRARQKAAHAAEHIVEEEAAAFLVWLRSQSAVATIRDFRARNEAIRDEVLSRSLNALQGGGDAEQILRQLANQLCNRLMHAPTRALNRAGENGQADELRIARDVLGLEQQQAKPVLSKEIQ